MAHSIWIPSIQQFVKFDAFTTGDQLALAKAVELELTKTTGDFDNHFVDMLDVKVRQPIDISSLTVLDKLLISIQFAINYVSHVINRTYHCPVCEESTVNRIQAASVYQQLQKYIDRTYKTCVKHGRMTVDFDVMSLGKQLVFDAATADGDRIIANDIEPLAWIENIHLNEQSISVKHLDVQQMKSVCKMLPNSVVAQAKSMIAFHRTPKKIATLKCGKCNNTEAVNFSIEYVNDIVVALLQLNASMIYDELFKLKTNNAIGSISDGMLLAPNERMVFLKMLQANEPKPDNR